MNYWAVGAAHGSTDVSKDFLDQGIWYDGYAEDGDDRNRSTLNEVAIGDLILMKSSSTKGANHSITFTKLKGVGKVISKDDYHYFRVKWFDIDELPIDFDGISYRKTIEPLRDDEMLEFAQSITEKEKREMIIDLLKYKSQIILQGPPGTGKTRQAKLIAEELTKPRTVGNPESIIDDLVKNFNPNDETIKTSRESIDVKTGIVAAGEFEIIQFHPAYSYEDFVRGIVADTTESGNISYQVENKILADFAQKATDNPNGNYVLIIDEINRANLPSVLGELIYALEYRNEPVTSIYEYEGEREITLPKNLFIIGTMNTADRSVGHIDYAIRRRFAFVDILPDENVIQNADAKILFNKIKTLFGNEFLSPDFKAKDVMIGHSYFLVKDADELRIKLEYEIKPILREYLKDGIFLEIANDKIELLNV
jgi:MoxR-like ATPase